MSADVHLIWKKSCDTCRKFKRQLDAWGVAYTERDRRFGKVKVP